MSTDQLRIYTWLGQWRDKMRPEAVEQLQDILGRPIASTNRSEPPTCSDTGPCHTPPCEDKKKCGQSGCVRIARTRGVELPEGRSPQHVLKAEGASPDATDRGICANASPGGGPMGAGQAAAAAPAGVNACGNDQPKGGA
jgi:hypothetical protein